MQLTRTSYIRILRIVVASVVIVLIVAYAIWRSLNYARGPAIVILEPENGSSAPGSTMTIKGHADRVNNLIMNGDQVSIDEQGNFVQSIIIFPGTNKITFTASDQFGRSTEKELDILGTVDFKAAKTPPPTASSSASNASSSNSSAR
jgi:hypothetical protein